MSVRAVAPAAVAASPAREVAPKKTPLSAAEVRTAIASAYRSLKGTTIPREMLDVLAAQACTETASGASMYNFNFGGIKGKSPEGATARLITREVFDGKEVTIRDGFRAYSTAQAGAADYISLLERRFPRALDRAREGDVDGFVRGLKAGNYFTADEGLYASALKGVIGRGFDGEVSAARLGTEPSRPIVASLDDPAALAGAPAESYATTLAVVRVLDAVNAASFQIAAPEEDAP